MNVIGDNKVLLTLFCVCCFKGDQKSHSRQDVLFRFISCLVLSLIMSIRSIESFQPSKMLFEPLNVGMKGQQTFFIVWGIKVKHGECLEPAICIGRVIYGGVISHRHK